MHLQKMSKYVDSDGGQNHISRKYQDKPYNLYMNISFIPTKNPVLAKDKERGSTKNITCYTGSQIPAMEPGHEYNGQHIVNDGSGNRCRLHLEKSKHPVYFKTALAS
jgi:hypothetical protein